MPNREPRLFKRRGPYKTHCVRGHPLTPENVRIETHGGRRCRACERERLKAVKRPPVERGKNDAEIPRSAEAAFAAAIARAGRDYAGRPT